VCRIRVFFFSFFHVCIFLSDYGQYTCSDNAGLIEAEVVEMIIYDRLWETMKTKGISQYRLIKYYGFSAGQIGRLKKNAYVSTHTIDVLCTILNCSVEDIIEFRLDTSLNPKLGIDPSVATKPPCIPLDQN